MKRLCKTNLISIIIILVLSSIACGNNNDAPRHVFQIYYINNDETGVLEREYLTDSEDTEAIVHELIAMLGTLSEKLEYKTPLGNRFKLLDYSLSGGQITLDFNVQYSEQSVITEILVRAAIVRTLTQVDGVDNVVMTIRGEPLTDGTGAIVGSMNGDMFIDNVGNEFNAYERTNLRLYFADESGERLKAVNRADMVYSSNVAIEKLIVESVIAGPLSDEGVRATVNAGTRVLSVTTTDGTCYVNLDEHFAQQVQGISAGAVVYSLVNSLVEIPNVNRVRIYLNGESGVIFESINLATVFERDLDIVN
ncbi:MAG: GerMN domain-containing protein [Lachnospiraceae bacterium]|nr:GerMN domain-containing protein [Lachnospiraceae bacterium]